MDVEERILTCRLIEQMESNSSYTKKLGLTNGSLYHGQPVSSFNNHDNDKNKGRKNHEKRKSNWQ